MDRRAEDGAFASFSLRLTGDRIASVGFRCTTCFTLVAYCERLCEMVEGLSLREAVLHSSNLVAELPGVPQMKQHRATVVRSAFLATVGQALQTLDATQ